MNKHLFRISLLCIVLILSSLCGCGATIDTPKASMESLPFSSETSPHSNQGSSPTDSTQDIAYIITIQFNPHFEIHVDTDGQIASLQPLNEDAKQLCDAVDVIHMTPENGLYALISQAHADGLLEDGDMVDILVEYTHFSHDSITEHFNSLGNSVRAYLNVNQMPNALITMNLSTRNIPEVQDPQVENQDTSSPEVSGDPYLLEFETSADGTMIYEKRLTGDGGTMEYHYSPLGYLETSIYRDVLGTIETTQYNSDGLPTSSIFIRIDGAQIHQTYGDAWNVIRTVIYESDGSVSTREFYPNSVLKSEHTLMADGSVIEVAWTEAGTQIYSKEQYANGLEGYILCYENGMTKESYRKEPNGSSFFTLYDENGNYTYEDLYFEGIRTERIYNEDRSHTETLFFPDGTKEILYINSAGKPYAGIDRQGKSFTLINTTPVYDEE